MPCNTSRGVGGGGVFLGGLLQNKECQKFAFELRQMNYLAFRTQNLWMLIPPPPRHASVLTSQCCELTVRVETRARSYFTVLSGETEEEQNNLVGDPLSAMIRG